MVSALAAMDAMVKFVQLIKLVQQEVGAGITGASAAADAGGRGAEGGVGDTRTGPGKTPEALWNLTHETRRTIDSRPHARAAVRQTNVRGEPRHGQHA